MGKKDYKEFMASLKKQKQELLVSADARIRYLKSIGILTKSGKISYNNKELCMPKGQG